MQSDLTARAEQTRTVMRSCRLCARECRVDRIRGERGRCGLGAGARWFREMIDYGDEWELIPAHSVHLTGCNMRCVFCTADPWVARPEAGEVWDPAAMKLRVEQRRREGASTLLFVGGEPTLSLAAVLDLLALLPDRPPVVWDSNMYFGAEARDLLEGVVDVYAGDFKFGNDRCALTVADAPHYLETVTGNLRWADRTASLVVRHLLLPGHLDCCTRPILRWLTETLPRPRVSLRGRYMPPTGRAAGAGLAGYVDDDEHARACELARDMGVGLVQ